MKPSRVVRRPAWPLLLLLCATPSVSRAQTAARPAATATSPPQARATPDPAYAGSEACLACHEGRSKQFKQTKMGKMFFNSPANSLQATGCEACHGPSRGHVEAGGGKGVGVISFRKGGPSSGEEQNAQCLQCHDKGLRLFWRGSPHESRGVTCVTCHQVMARHSESVRYQEPLAENRSFAKATQAEVCFQCHPMRRAQLQRSSHMPFREGRMTCSSCHNPHGSPNPKQLIEATTNENCYKCHAERRGPFLWEHPPVLENCLNCHDAHGSSNPQLLKARAPRLCQQCHDVSDNAPGHTGAPMVAAGKGSHFAFNRGCTNCHSEIHGSNHPSGVRFHR